MDCVRTSPERSEGLALPRIKDPSLGSGFVDAAGRTWWLALLCTGGFASPALVDIQPIPLSPTAVAACAQTALGKEAL
ncbi:MAG: hypothetical protein HYX51_09195 [Chloroflexi bacterium]|nr:hypothetical protein [Chloroflexota bacterium]